MNIEEVVQMAEGAGEIILKYYKQSMETVFKEDRSPLTKADLEANRFIVDRLKELYPDIPIVSEEDELPAFEVRKDWARFWLVDPLDGTAEFINHLDEFTVNIALIENGIPVLGVIFAPARDLLYFAEVGKGAWKRSKKTESPSRIYSNEPRAGGPVTIVESRRHGKDELDEFLKTSKVEVKKRVPAGSSIKFCLVAEGAADIYPRMGPTMEWDVAAGDCIYRNSAKNGMHKTTLSYNKRDLKNGTFVIGM
jgi:3'(2'), 5'-bisphosphate nucleotidase